MIPPIQSLSTFKSEILRRFKERLTQNPVLSGAVRKIVYEDLEVVLEGMIMVPNDAGAP